MITDIAYEQGKTAAWDSFMKTSGVPITTFAKKVVPAATQVAAPAAAAAVKPAGPVFGGAAAAAPAAGAPAAGGGWKGLAKDVGVQMAVPLGMMGLQKMMEPSPPKDPNAI